MSSAMLQAASSSEPLVTATTATVTTASSANGSQSASSTKHQHLFSSSSPSPAASSSSNVSRSSSSPTPPTSLDYLYQAISLIETRNTLNHQLGQQQQQDNNNHNSATAAAGVNLNDFLAHTNSAKALAENLDLSKCDKNIQLMSNLIYQHQSKLNSLNTYVTAASNHGSKIVKNQKPAKYSAKKVSKKASLKQPGSCQSCLIRSKSSVDLTCDPAAGWPACSCSPSPSQSQAGGRSSKSKARNSLSGSSSSAASSCSTSKLDAANKLLLSTFVDCNNNNSNMRMSESDYLSHAAAYHHQQQHQHPLMMMAPLLKTAMPLASPPSRLEKAKQFARKQAFTPQQSSMAKNLENNLYLLSQLGNSDFSDKKLQQQQHAKLDLLKQPISLSVPSSPSSLATASTCSSSSISPLSTKAGSHFNYQMAPTDHLKQPPGTATANTFLPFYLNQFATNSNSSNPQQQAYQMPAQSASGPGSSALYSSLVANLISNQSMQNRAASSNYAPPPPPLPHHHVMNPATTNMFNPNTLDHLHLHHHQQQQHLNSINPHHVTPHLNNNSNAAGAPKFDTFYLQNLAQLLYTYGAYQQKQQQQVLAAQENVSNMSKLNDLLIYSLAANNNNNNSSQSALQQQYLKNLLLKTTTGTAGDSSKFYQYGDRAAASSEHGHEDSKQIESSDRKFESASYHSNYLEDSLSYDDMDDDCGGDAHKPVNRKVLVSGQIEDAAEKVDEHFKRSLGDKYLSQPEQQQKSSSKNKRQLKINIFNSNLLSNDDDQDQDDEDDENLKGESPGESKEEEEEDEASENRSSPLSASSSKSSTLSSSSSSSVFLPSFDADKIQTSTAAGGVAASSPSTNKRKMFLYRQNKLKPTTANSNQCESPDDMSSQNSPEVETHFLKALGEETWKKLKLSSFDDKSSETSCNGDALAASSTSDERSATSSPAPSSD